MARPPSVAAGNMSFAFYAKKTFTYFAPINIANTTADVKPVGLIGELLDI